MFVGNYRRFENIGLVFEHLIYLFLTADLLFFQIPIYYHLKFRMQF